MVTFYSSSLLTSSMPAGEPLDIRGAEKPGLVTKNGLVLFGNDGKAVSAQNHVWVFLLLPQLTGNGFLWRPLGEGGGRLKVPVSHISGDKRHSCPKTKFLRRAPWTFTVRPLRDCGWLQKGNMDLCLSTCWLGKDGSPRCASVFLSIKHGGRFLPASHCR